jgi:hypothetical protein
MTMKTTTVFATAFLSSIVVTVVHARPAYLRAERRTATVDQQSSHNHGQTTHHEDEDDNWKVAFIAKMVQLNGMSSEVHALTKSLVSVKDELACIKASKMFVSDDGDLVQTDCHGKQLLIGRVKGEVGPAGNQGPPGLQGERGPSGEPGVGTNHPRISA